MSTNPVVSPQWLYQHLENPHITIVDCRFALNAPQKGQAQYQAGHIPGAYYLDLNKDLSSPVQPHGGRHPLPNPSQLAAKLSQMGINADTLVVAYDDSRQAFASRLWWLLRYLGHKKVAVLDGGFGAYQAHYPVTTVVPDVRSGEFQASPNPEQVVDIQAVKTRKHQLDVALVDSRARNRYLGEHEPIDPVAGHIPGAVNYPWQAVTDEQGYLLPASKLQIHYADLEKVDEVIVYCGSGVTACVNILALEIAGIKSSKLYAGSWSDWCSYPLDQNMDAHI